jgi:hypothetical protein
MREIRMAAERLGRVARDEKHDARHGGQVLRERDGDRLDRRVLLVSARLPARGRGRSRLARLGKRRRGQVDDGDALSQEVRAPQGPALRERPDELRPARPLHHGRGDRPQEGHIVERRGDVPRLRVEQIVDR